MVGATVGSRSRKCKLKGFRKRIELEKALNLVRVFLRNRPDFSLASTKLHRTFLASHPFRYELILGESQFLSRATSKCSISALT